MDRLALCQRLASECGSSATLTTTISQTGENARFVNWLDQAWLELQTKHDDWTFMRSSNQLGAGATFATVDGQASYPLGTGVGTVGILAANFGKWDPYSFRNYTTTVGTQNESHLDWIPYDSWRDAYMFGANRSVKTRPVAVAIGPDNSVCLGPASNGLYTVIGDYYTAPTAMAADTDTPTGLPAQFHMLLVYGGMEYYAAFEAAPEVQQRGQIGRNRMLKQLEALRAPQISFSGALC